MTSSAFLYFFQLNDVPAGGRTVFPRLGVGTDPIAGAAVFWYNLHESGEADQDTLHGACPMLHGTKWGKTKYDVTKIASPYLRYLLLCSYMLKTVLKITQCHL